MLRQALLHINFFFAYPIYSMVHCFLLFLILFIYGSNIIRSFLILYLLYVLFDSTPKSGGWNENEKIRRFARNALPFRLMKEYLNVELVRDNSEDKVEQLDPSRPYLFLYHPHGIIGIGCNTAFTTNACNFDKLFPGIRRSVCTLNASFLVPFYRECLLANGLISANKKTIVRQLNEGKSIVLVPGGASEALLTHPGQYVIVLKKRKGFIRLALSTGKDMFPSYFPELLHFILYTSYHRC